MSVTELAVTVGDVPPIVANFEAVRESLTASLATFQAWTPETEEEYKALKSDRADLRKLMKGIDDQRMRVKDAYERPLKAFEVSVKELLGPAKELEARMKEEVDGYELRWKEARKARLRDKYAEMAPYIALPLPGQAAPLVPIERFEEPRWYLRGTAEKEAEDGLVGKVNAIAAGEAAVKAMHLAHEQEALAVYWMTLQVTAARERDQELCDAEAAAKALEEQRARAEAEIQARAEAEEARRLAETPQEATQAPEAVQMPAPTPPASPEPPQTPAEPTFRLEAWGLTVEQVREMRDYLAARSIHGRITREA